MRTDEERIAMMYRRAAELEKENKSRQIRLRRSGSITASLAVLVILSAVMPRLSTGVTPETAGGVMSASIFARSSMLGFLVIGIIAFLLGIAVTVFCFRLKKWQEENTGD